MKVGLVGNQNSGKTTLFNYLTGMNAKIGNWPGVTIEKKTGIIKGTNHELTDLPGIYSLSPYSIEEEISRKYVFDEKPDVIIDFSVPKATFNILDYALKTQTPIVIDDDDNPQSVLQEAKTVEIIAAKTYMDIKDITSTDYWVTMMNLA